MTNGNPNTVMFAPPNWDPNGVGFINGSAVPGVQVDGFGQSEVINEDFTPIAPKTAFNLLIFSS